MSTVLIVDDEAMVADVLSTMLTGYGHTVSSITSSITALDMLEIPYDLYLFDLRMPQVSGAELAEAVFARHANAKVLIMTGFPSDPLAARALRCGVLALVKKPFEIGKILAHLEGTSNRNGGNG
jgi:DNA-binding NtrC family response regulator